MAENNSELMSELEEFLAAKAERQKEEESNEDFDVEIWDEKGRGVRTKRSHAKPFLQSLGIDVDPEPPKTDGNDDGKGKKPPTKPRQSAPSASAVRKYFAPKGKTS